MTNVNPILKTDSYKFSHMTLYAPGTEYVYETLTPRENSYFPWDDKMVVFGYQLFWKMLQDDFKTNFFGKSWTLNYNEIYPVVKQNMGQELADKVMVQFENLWHLGYLPIKATALPEGTKVPMQIPVMTVENTDPNFYWLPGYLETIILSDTFVMSTVATMAYNLRKIAEEYADKTAMDNGFVDFQFHDFSQRGQHGNDATTLSGIGHLSSFKGTDAIQTISVLSKYSDRENIVDYVFGGSVLATEHSVMEGWGTDQIRTYDSLIEANPNGILSVVSDTYDYWEVLDYVLPTLKDKIMARNGKLVIRPDSLSTGFDKIEDELVASLDSLWDTFGGTVNAKGYRVLDSHIGILHGEGVSLDNVHAILDAIVGAGYSTENIVLGVGAYVYSVLVSRDSFGQAIKATDVIINGKEMKIFKKPKSEKEAFKASHKGRVRVTIDEDGEITVKDNLTKEAVEENPGSMLTIFNNGDTSIWSFEEARQAIKK